MERKFTDNEIVKALEMCNYNADCDNCPCVGECWNVNKYAIDLINRQKAEIESLKEAYAIYEETTGLKWVRTEAIKEFAERLKERKWQYTETEHTFDFDGVDVDEIDNLVKEMTEEQK